MIRTTLKTLIVVAGHYLDALELPLWIEAPLLVGTTALGCWLFYDLGAPGSVSARVDRLALENGAEARYIICTSNWGGVLASGG